MKEVIETINEKYLAVYGHPIIGASQGPKIKRSIDLISGVLSSVKLNKGDSIKELCDFYFTGVFSYFNRSFGFSPTLALLCSQKLLKILDKYKDGVKITDSERFMINELHPMLPRNQGLFFGYVYDDIKKFSPHSAPHTMVVNAVMERKEQNFLPSNALINMMDLVFFMKLGNNFIGELYNKDLELHTDYEYLTKLLKLRKYYLRKREEMTSGNIYRALGYKTNFKLGSATVTYCDGILWMKGLKYNDSAVIELIMKLSKLNDEELFKLPLVKYLEDHLKLIQDSIPKKEWEFIKRAMYETDMPTAQRRLKEFKTNKK